MELIPITGAELYYDPHVFQSEEATDLFATLLRKCAWERRKASFGGRARQQRLVGAINSTGTPYKMSCLTFSGSRHSTSQHALRVRLRSARMCMLPGPWLRQEWPSAVVVVHLPRDQ
jgi:hypothetical protein